MGVSLAAGENRPKSSIAGANTSDKSLEFLFSWFMVQLRGTVPRWYVTLPSAMLEPPVFEIHDRVFDAGDNLWLPVVAMAQ